MRNSTNLWPTFTRVLRRQQLMDCMMQSSGVDVAIAVRMDGGLAFMEARTSVAFAEDACANWLSSAGGQQEAPDFCPNAGFFFECSAKTTLGDGATHKHSALLFGNCGRLWASANCGAARSGHCLLTQVCRSWLPQAPRPAGHSSRRRHSRRSAPSRGQADAI
jgi:Family of unknown function (DUF6455)